MSDEREKEFVKAVIKLDDEFHAPLFFKMEAESALEEYYMYKMFDGLPPNPGGRDDQPAYWIDYIVATKAADNKVEYDRQLEEQEKAEREARKKK